MTFGQPEIEENDIYLEPEQFPEDNREIRKPVTTIQKTSNSNLNLEDENYCPETSTVIEATNKKQGKTRFTEEELSILKNFYAQNPYPSTKERERLANEINCLEKQIKYWFQNTRVAEKKSSANGLVNVSASYTLLENSTSHSKLKFLKKWPFGVVPKKSCIVLLLFQKWGRKFIFEPPKKPVQNFKRNFFPHFRS